MLGRSNIGGSPSMLDLKKRKYQSTKGGTYRKYMPSYRLVTDGDDKICLYLDSDAETTRETSEPKSSHRNPGCVPTLVLTIVVSVRL